MFGDKHVGQDELTKGTEEDIPLEGIMCLLKVYAEEEGGLVMGSTSLLNVGQSGKCVGNVPP